MKSLFFLILIITGALALFLLTKPSTKEPLSLNSTPADRIQSAPKPIMTPTMTPDPQMINENRKTPAPSENEEFHKITEEALKTLPRQTDAAGMSEEEVHQTPAVLIQKIQPLLRVNKMVKANPALKDDAFEFYMKCASQKEIMTSVRARCLTHLRQLASDLGRPLDLTVFPSAVKKLSEFIPF